MLRFVAAAGKLDTAAGKLAIVTELPAFWQDPATREPIRTGPV